MNTIYQYQEVNLNVLQRVKETRASVLNEYGADGWQLVAILPNMVAIMMRAIEEPRPKRAYTRRQTTEAQHAAA